MMGELATRVLVACAGGRVIGTIQILMLPGLSRRGMWRGQIEGVRVEAALRGHGIGRRLVQLAIARCDERGCGMIQLTTDASRRDAHRFYEKLGIDCVTAPAAELGKAAGAIGCLTGILWRESV